MLQNTERIPEEERTLTDKEIVIICMQPFVMEKGHK